MYRAISQMNRVFAHDPRDLGSIPGRVIPKTQDLIPPCLTLSIIRSKDKVKQSNEKE